MQPDVGEQTLRPDPYAELAKKEQAAKNHDEWIDIHNEGLLTLFESGKITRDEYLKKRKQERKDSEKQALTDHLTGILNRRGLDYELQRQLEEAGRMVRDTGFYLGSVIFFDVDKFKLINDRYGHHVGDKVLVTYTKAIQDNIRPKDVVSRYGGDEFVVYTPEATQEQAKEVADRVRQGIIEAFKKTEIILDWEQTISAGISQLRSDDNPQSLLNRADTALYYAKEQGRNQAVIFEDDKMELKAVKGDST